MTVVTYSFAYLAGAATLCRSHAGDEPTLRMLGIPLLGPVSHGAHEGRCEACARIHAQAEVTAESRAFRQDQPVACSARHDLP